MSQSLLGMSQSNSTTNDDFFFDNFPSSMEASRESETDSNIPVILDEASQNERKVPVPGNDEQQGERTQTEQFTSDNAAFSQDGAEDTKETSPEHERGLNLEVARLKAQEPETPSGTGQDLSRGRVQAADSDPDVDRRSVRDSALGKVLQFVKNNILRYGVQAPNQEKNKEGEWAVSQQIALESPALEKSLIMVDYAKTQLPSPDHRTLSPVQQVEYQTVQPRSRPVPADRPVNRYQRVEYGSEQLFYTHGPPEQCVNRSPWNTNHISRESPGYLAPSPQEEQQYHSYQYPSPFQYQQQPVQPPPPPPQQQRHQQPTSMTTGQPWLPEQQSYEYSMQREGAKSPPQAWQRTPGSQFTGHQYYHHHYHFQQRPPPAQPARRPVFPQEHHLLPWQGSPPTEGFRHQQGDVYRAPHPTRATPVAYASGQRMPPAYAQQYPPVGGMPPQHQVAAASMMSGTSATPPPAGGRAGRIPATSTQRGTGNVSGGMQQESQARNRPPAAPSPTQCQLEEDSCRTVRVSGGPVAVNKLVMTLYFKNNRRSGGGPISRVEVNHQEGTALVTFEQKADADRVVKRSHSVDNTDLNVVLCQSEDSNTRTPHQPEGGCTKVKVRGLPAEATKTVLCLYFEDLADTDCVQVTMGPRRGEAVVEFQDPEVARAILAQSHTIADQVLTVTPYTTPTTTMPTSPPTTTTRQTTPTTATAAGGGGGRRGGSRPSAGPSPAPRVLERSLAEPVTTGRQYAERQRQSAGRPVQEGSGEEEKARNSSQRQGATASEGESAPVEGAMVSVRGLPAEQSEDVLMLYFENFRRSGGGDVREVYLDEQTGVFFLTFYKAEDAKRVAARSHTIHNQRLDVRLEDPPKPYSDRILLKNLPPLQTGVELLNFVEAKTKQTVDSIRFGEDGATAVIIFTTCITFGEVEAAICKKQWKGQELKVRPLHQSCTVLVENLPQHHPVSEDLLTNFFENTQRHGGGEVSAVQIDKEGQYALVTFVDPAVAARVSGRQDYELQKCSLAVSLYMDCLGVSGGKSEPAATIPPPHPLTDSQCQKLTHLQGVPGLMQGLQESLTASNARLELGRGRGSIVCTLTQEVKNVHQLAKTWAQDVDRILQSHLQPVIVQQVELTAEEFAQAERQCLQTMGREEKMKLAYDEGKQILTIVYQEEKQPVADELLTIVQIAQREVERKKQEQTDKVAFTKGKQQLLKEHQDIQDAREKYPRLEIVFNEEDDRIELKGLKEEIDCVKMLFLKVSNDMTTLQHSWNSNLHKKLMSKQIARSTVESLCKACCPDAVIEFTDDGFLAHSFDAETAETAQTTAVQAVQTRVILFDDDCRHAVKLQEWEALKCSIKKNHDQLVEMEETEETLTMVGIGPSVQRDYRRLVEFLEENGISQQVLQVPSVLHGLFEPYLKEKVNELNLRQDNFVFGHENDLVIITGNTVYVEAAQSIFNAFLQEITHKQVTYTQPSMAAFLQTREWTRKQEYILRNARCMVLDPENLPEMTGERMSGWRDGDAASGQMPSEMGAMASDGRDTQQTLPSLASRESRRHVSARDSAFPSTDEPITGSERHLFFEETRGRVDKMLVGLGDEAVERADKELLACYEGTVDTYPVNDLRLSQWDVLDRVWLVSACRTAQVDITMDFDLGRLTLRGFRHNLDKVPVHEITRKAEAAVAEQQEAMMVVKEVQWSTIEMQTTGFVVMPYSIMNNYKIEMEYRRDEDGTTINKNVDGDPDLCYFIDFNKMEEIFLDTDSAAGEGAHLTIIRQTMIEGPEVLFPKKWSSMQGKLVDRVTLQPSSAEYRGIADVFRDSLNMPSATIKKIERIQNVTLYQQYQALKQQMESTMPQNKPCELPKLWHGTSAPAVDGIVRYGFNRSFGSVYRSAYGQGAYFVSTAEYAARNEYAKLDDFNQRNIFLCRVLVGRYTKGDMHMRVPPEPTAGGPRFHSTVDDVEQPTIFVTYNDVQAYPDYRIVFKDS